MRHRDFVDAFLEAFEVCRREQADIAALFADAKGWTHFMLGMPPARVPAGVLRVAATAWANAPQRADQCSLHGQWYTLDLCAVTPPYATNNDYWSTRTVLTIEHENGYDVETEMWKLAHWRADLSVLVFYDFSEAERASGATCTSDKTLPNVKKADWLDLKMQGLSNIVRRVDGDRAERHLLIVGSRVSRPDGAQILWRFYEWDASGFALVH